MRGELRSTTLPHRPTNTMENFNLEDIIGFEALFESMEKCKHNVLWKASVSNFVLFGVKNILELEDSLHDGTYKAKPPKEVQIQRPKKRTAYSISFKDRVYQRSLNDNSLYKQMTSGFIYDNFACQKHKGTDLARKRLKEFLHGEYVRSGGQEVYVLKCDIKGYYDNIDHTLAEKLIRKKCDKTTADLAIAVLRNQYKGDKGYKAGSQMVQIIGISMLDGLDHYIKEKLRCKRYLRYMDDFLLVSSDKAYLEDCETKIAEFLKGVKLELHEKKTGVVSSYDGVDFLGFDYKLTKTGKVLMFIASKNVKAERKKLYRLAGKVKNGDATREKADQCYASWRDHASKGSSKRLLDAMDKYYIELLEG